MQATQPIKTQAFEDLTRMVAGAPSLDASLRRLIEGLAERMAATSNDQNVQTLARDLRAALPALVAAVCAKA